MTVNLKKIRERFPLMGASLLLAFLLWVLVIAEEKVEAGFMVPLVFDSIPESVVIDGPSTSSVYVQIRGTKQAVEGILPQQVRAHLDLSEAKPGNEYVQVTPQSIVLPKGITVVGVYPPYLDLKFLARRPVPVKVRTIGKTAEGYAVKGITALPLQVEIVGPQQRVESIKQVETYPVDINGLSQSLTVRAEFVQPGDDVRLLQLKPTEVVVEVVPRLEKRTFQRVPVRGGNQNVEFTPEAVTVVLEGAFHSIRGLAPEQIEVEVDWETKGEKPENRGFRVNVPQGFTVVSVKPPQVTIR